MIAEGIKAGICAWLNIAPNKEFCCSKCDFQFGEDAIDQGDRCALVLICHVSREGKSNCPDCGEVNIFAPGTMVRVRRLIVGSLITEQADMPVYWLTVATTEEVSDYFLDDGESGDSFLRKEREINAT